jgi:hypothetical protein
LDRFRSRTTPLKCRDCQSAPAAINDLSPGSVDNSVGNAATTSLNRPRSGHFCSLPKVCAVRKLLKSRANFPSKWYRLTCHNSLSRLWIEYANQRKHRYWARLGPRRRKPNGMLPIRNHYGLASLHFGFLGRSLARPALPPAAPPHAATRVQPPDWFQQQLAAARAARRAHHPQADTVGAQKAYDNVFAHRMHAGRFGGTG